MLPRGILGVVKPFVALRIYCGGCIFYMLSFGDHIICEYKKLSIVTFISP